MPTRVVEDQMSSYQNNNKSYFAEWIPPRYKKSATFIGNSTAIKGMFERVSGQFKGFYF
ncbi:unnamed protein product [Meloidogyne enterolobii]|uniref:Uncharacterized protein n=1 Tax=Meloidogyne enterolobii TaxID=390850 RepID=A0ACB1AP39_MELEN